MILPPQRKSTPAPVVLPDPEPDPEPQGMTPEQIIMLAQRLRPVVTVQAPKPLSEWVFTVHRDGQGRIDTIAAKGVA